MMNLKFYLYLMFLLVLGMSDAVACFGGNDEVASPPPLLTTLLIMLCCFLLGGAWALCFGYQARFCSKFVKSKKSVCLAAIGKLAVLIGGLVVVKGITSYITFIIGYNKSDMYEEFLVYNGIAVNYWVFLLITGFSGIFFYCLKQLVGYIKHKEYKQISYFSCVLICYFAAVIYVIYADKFYNLSFYNSCPNCDCF